MQRFAGLGIVIIGGTSGIGLATAQRIASEGGRVLVTGTNADRIAVVGKMEGIDAIRSDATAAEDIAMLAEEASRILGGIDGVFLNVGIGTVANLGDIKMDDFNRIFRLNVAGPLLAAQALVPLMGRGASVLFMASGAKTKGIAGAALYAGSKGAIRSIALVLARELVGKGIRVNTISPGPIATDFHDLGKAGSKEAAEIADLLKAMIPMGRMGSVEEAANVAAFLLSPESSFITGADYAVDGGEAQL